MPKGWDFCGYATRNDIQCQDGRIIRHNAFAECDGDDVPIFWNHNHLDMSNILGHAILENRDDGVYAYGYLNDETEQGRGAKARLKHGDIKSLSIWANNLTQKGHDVIHGVIREVSLVTAGANPGAFVDVVMAHSADGGVYEDGLIMGFDENIMICHSADEDDKDTNSEEDKSKKDNKSEENKSKGKGKTIADVLDRMTEEQLTATYALIGAAMQEKSDDDKDGNADDSKDLEHSEEETDMKKNIFETQTQNNQTAVISHSMQKQILDRARNQKVMSFRDFLKQSIDASDTLAHGVDNIDALFPDYELVTPGEPEMVTRDKAWVKMVLDGAKKTPFGRIRTRQADIRDKKLTAVGYKKATEKTFTGNWKLLTRTLDAQTVYVKDKIDRDDVLDIVDFDMVAYEAQVMKILLEEKVALCMLVGDGLADEEDGKVYEQHIQSIYNDDELYTIHMDVDIDAAKTELQGTNTSAYFGDNYIYAQALRSSALHARETYKGSGHLTMFCVPSLLNNMLLAKDMNGRDLYASAEDVAKAFHVDSIETVEQLEGITRTDSDGNKHKLLALFVNMADYTLGCVKGGEITNFDQFDIDFNQYKFLQESRLCGGLTKILSAIALEEAVTTTSSSTTTDTTDDEDAA